MNDLITIIVPKEEINGLGFLQLRDFPRISNEMNKKIIETTNKFSLSAKRILLTIVATLYEKQSKFAGKDKWVQLDLFDNEWMNTENSSLLNTQMNFKISDFLKEKSKNVKPIHDGLDEIAKKSIKIEFEKIDQKGNIKKYTTYSPIFTYVRDNGKKNGVKISINNFWYREFLNISKGFNYFSKDIIFNLSDRALNFYLYLKMLPDITNLKGEEKQIYDEVKENLGLHEWFPKGTRMQKDLFKKKFLDNMKIYDYELKRTYLDVWRTEMNKLDISFGYKLDENYITIVTYKPTKQLLEKRIMSSDEAKIKRAVVYKIKKYNLENLSANFLISLYTNYTYDVVTNALGKEKELIKLVDKGNKKEDKLKNIEIIKKMGNIVSNYIKTNNINIEQIKYPNHHEMYLKLTKKYPKIDLDR